MKVEVNEIGITVLTAEDGFIIYSKNGGIRATKLWLGVNDKVENYEEREDVPEETEETDNA